MLVLLALMAQTAPPPAEPAPAVAPARPAAPPATFEAGLGAFYADDFATAAAQMYDYVATNPGTVDNYEWAEYFLGVSLARLNFSGAAAEYLFNVAKNRTRPEILPDALLELETLLAGPHDESLLDEKLLADTDFGYLPAAIADFVYYHQGLQDLRADRLQWAQRLFDRIRENSPYLPQAWYALAVEHLRKNDNAAAVQNFKRALNHPQADRDTRNRARLALARILYEAERYDGAKSIYDQVEVPELTTAEASLYLEKAWTLYWMRDYRRAMGILYALEAPSYRDYFAPEKFLLRALIYQNLCHYIPAKREIRRFRLRFGRTLDTIRARADLREDPVLRGAALQRGILKRRADFRRMIAQEADSIDNLGGSWVEVGLDEHLRRIYQLKAQKLDLELDSLLRREARTVAEELVDFEEQMYLLDYEIGLAIYRRLRKEDARRPTEDDSLDIPIGGRSAYYNFTDEFWNDELAHLQFFVENRCFDEGAKE